MCLTEAAFRRTACGSRLKEDVEPKLDLVVGAAVCLRTSLRLASNAETVAAAASCAGDEPRGDTVCKDSVRGNSSGKDPFCEDSAGSGVLTDSSRAETTGMAAVAGSAVSGGTTGIAAVAGSWAVDSPEFGPGPAAGTLAVGTLAGGTMAGGTMGMAAVGGPGVVDFRAAGASGAITA